ncbi:uncharacterized protein LOC114731279 [Neltuma alba]|uniref:uncharacterized protein LOC114726402 n=1 Tax=Neltuma alba TaxID=207710 RepID=UPI0010A405B3|nr:uncharacterized protein LOC114726402 [Prosopis alba]XP_028774253.1 uncharacterized protein LOC114731279 [Prosopis alba]
MAAELPRSNSKPALLKKPSAAAKSRRHAFFEMPFQPPPPPFRWSGRSDVGELDHVGGRCRSYCFSICTWACIGIFTLTIILLLIGISYLVFLRSGLPHVNMTKLQFHNSQQMNSVLELELTVSNKNQKLRLIYGPLAFDVTSEDVKLEKTKITGFRQNPQNDTFLDAHMKVYNNAGVNPNAAGDTQSESNAHEAVFDVYLSGSIGFDIGTLHTISVPFLSACYEVKEIDVRLGRRPKCDIRMFAFR